MRKNIKFFVLYAAWIAYNLFGYAAFAQMTIDKAANAAIVHTYQLAGADTALRNVHLNLGTIYQ